MTGEQRAVSHFFLILRGTNEQGKYVQPWRASRRLCTSLWYWKELTSRESMYSQFGRAEAFVHLSDTKRNKRAGKIRTAMTGEQKPMHSFQILGETNEQGKYVPPWRASRSLCTPFWYWEKLTSRESTYSHDGRAEGCALLSHSERNKRAGKVRTAVTGQQRSVHLFKNLNSVYWEEQTSRENTYSHDGRAEGYAFLSRLEVILVLLAATEQEGIAASCFHVEVIPFELGRGTR